MIKKQTDTEILKNKEYGEVAEVARIMGLSRANVTMILRRPNSKKFAEAIRILREIVEARQQRRQRIQGNN